MRKQKIWIIKKLNLKLYYSNVFFFTSVWENGNFYTRTTFSSPAESFKANFNPINESSLFKAKSIRLWILWTMTFLYHQTHKNNIKTNFESFMRNGLFSIMILPLTSFELRRFPLTRDNSKWGMICTRTKLIDNHHIIIII